jgi:hypothetical protein
VWCIQAFFTGTSYSAEIFIRILSIVIVGFFALMVTGLYVYHTYLALVN